MDMILEEYKTKLQVVEKTAGIWNRDIGKYEEGIPKEIDFIGAVLPLSQDDLIKNPEGTYTRDDRKLYTSKQLTKGQIVIWNNLKWKVNNDNDYGYIDVDFKRYFLVRAGVAGD